MSGVQTLHSSRNLTCPSLFCLLRRNSKDIQYFNHYLYNDVCHRLGRWDFGVGLETFEKILNTLKDVDQDLLGRSNVLSRLEEDTSTSEDHCRG
jgi:hypothetical protein